MNCHLRNLRTCLPEEKNGPVDMSLAAQERRGQLRAQAARDLVNIDLEEREKRRLASYGLALVAFIGALVLLWSHAPWYSRSAVFPAIALAWGFNLSAQEGL